ncbi:MAG: hypothetical protein ABEJ24_01315 [Candidatus Magasanikbacteria bacterium]
MIERERRDEVDKKTEFVNLESEGVQDFFKDLELSQEKESKLKDMIKKGASIHPNIWNANFREFFKGDIDLDESELFGELKGFKDATEDRREKRSGFSKQRSRKVLEAIELLDQVITEFNPKLASSFVVLMGNHSIRKEDIEDKEYF